MKKRFIAAIVFALGMLSSLAMAPATAAEIVQSAGTAQTVQQHTGIVWGNTSSMSNGSVTAAAQLIGAGEASQGAFSGTKGSATFGGKLDSTGTTVFSGSTQDANAGIKGTYSGNVQLQDPSGIQTGASAFATTVSQAKVDSNFEVKQYGSNHFNGTQQTYNQY